MAKAVSELAATATATASSPHHHASRYTPIWIRPCNRSHFVFYPRKPMFPNRGFEHWPHFGITLASNHFRIPVISYKLFFLLSFFWKKNLNGKCLLSLRVCISRKLRFSTIVIRQSCHIFRLEFVMMVFRVVFFHPVRNSQQPQFTSTRHRVGL